jgi:hypothetical protein
MTDKIARTYARHDKFINTKMVVWVDGGEYWHYVWVNILDGKLYIEVDNHWFERLDDHRITRMEELKRTGENVITI